jgi:hypothetical protein
MNSPDSISISMNSSRPLETIKEKNTMYKELLQEKEEKIKELSEKNEKYEKDCLKFQIQIKNLEEKIRIKQEKEYVVQIFIL